MDPVLLRQILENSEPSSQNANPNRALKPRKKEPHADEEPGLEVDPEAAQNLMGSIQAGIEGARAGTKVPLPVKSLGLLLVARSHP